MKKWTQFKMKDIFDLQMGKTPARDNAAYWNNGEHKWISISDIGRCSYFISDTKETISTLAVSETNMKKIPSNTLIMSFKLSIGKVAVTVGEMYSNEAIMAFIDKKVIQLHIPFLYHLFRWKDWSYASNKAVKGITLNKKALNEIKIQIPELDVQIKIASDLEKIISTIQKRKKQLDIIDVLAKSRFSCEIIFEEVAA